MQEAAEKLAPVTKREQQLKAAKARLAQQEEKTYTYEDLCDVVTSIADKIARAERGRSNLTARKNTLQSASGKWEKEYCEPVIQLADLVRQVNIERDEHERKFAELVKTVQEREEQAAKLLQQRQQEITLLLEEKQRFIGEQDEWRHQKGQDLSETELKDTMKEYMENKIEELKPSMIHEARRLNLPIQNKQRVGRRSSRGG
jgi:hypothetical protein